MEYNKEESKEIKNVLFEFKQKEFRFVIPRGYDELPHSVPGGDVDIYVQQEDFEKLINLMHNMGFRPKSHLRTGFAKMLKHSLKLLVKGLKEPKRASKFILQRILEKRYKNSKQNKSNQTKYQEYKTYKRKIMIHIMNHIAYESPLDGSMIRTDPAVEKNMFDNVIYFNGIPVPSKPDELSHLVCRGIFSYKGNFPSYYVKKCKELFQEISESEDDLLRFEKLIKLIFYKADGLVLQHVEAGNYNQIRASLLKFSNY